MGDFSRDPEARLQDSVDKHYVGVRLQQGVAVLDADWNELEDLRRHELETTAGRFIGDGVPVGSDGFRISAVDAPNDFRIEAGLSLVNGKLVRNDEAVRFSTQPHADDPTLDAPIAPLETPESDVELVVCLDVWEREVDPADDPSLVDPRIGVWTCVRAQRLWVVRAVPADDLPGMQASRSPDRRLYPLARIRRAAGEETIAFDDLTDLRRTDLTLARGEGEVRVYGAGGGLQYGMDDFIQLCANARVVYQDLLGSDVFLAHHFEPADPVEGLVLLDAFQDVKTHFRLAETAARHDRVGNGRALELLAAGQEVQESFCQRLLPLSEPETSRVVTTRFLEQLRDLVAGAADDEGLGPEVEAGSLRGAIDAQLAINDFVGARSAVLPRGRVEVSFVEGPPPAELVVAPGVYRFVYDVTSEVTLEETFDLQARLPGADDWEVSLPPELELAPGETRQVDVDVTVPADTPNDASSLVLRVRSRRNPGRIDFSNDEVDIQLESEPPAPVPISLQLVSPAINVAEDVIEVGRGDVPGLGLPGNALLAVFEVSNTEEAAASRDFTVSFEFSVADTFEPIADQDLQVAGGGSVQESVRLEATAAAENGNRADMTVTVTRDDDPELSRSLVVQLEVQKG